jgi:hypothetical protein
LIKGKSILEVIIVFALMLLLSWWLNARLQPLGVEVRRWLGGFIFIALSLIIMALTRRPWREYGLTLKDWRLSFDAGMTGYVARLIPMGVLFALILLGESYRWSWLAGAIIGVRRSAASGCCWRCSNGRIRKTRRATRADRS